MSSLPEPQFVDRDPKVILAEIIASYESKAGRPLEPEQAERLLLDIVAYRETLVRNRIQDAAKQNLRAYARFPMIDFLAELLGTSRLDAKPSTTPERFTLEAALGVPTPIPSGTRVRTKDAKVIFTTDEDVTIAAGETEVEVNVTATEAGPIGNGYAPGQVSEILDDLGVTITAANTSTTANGRPAEDSERLRDRIPDELGEYAAAGPEDAYKAHAKASHPDVLDVYVENPLPGVVRVHVLATYGVPDPTLLDTVEAALSSEDVRPLCDTVEVVAAVQVDYAIDAALVLKKGALEAETVAAATEAADEFVTDRASRLGRSLIPVQLTSKLSKPEVDEETGELIRPELAAVYDVLLTTPVATTLARNEFANCTGVSVTFDSYSEES